MKEALVVHPLSNIHGGGEMILLHVCKALQDMAYRVSLASDAIPSEIESFFGMGNILRNCNHIPLPPFKPTFPRFLVLQRIRYAERVRGQLEQVDPEVVFNTQPSILSSFDFRGKPAFRFIYNVEDPEPVKFPYYIIFRRYRTTAKNNTWFLALARSLLKDLKAKGYENSIFIYPPCRSIFKPMIKRKQVIMVARVVPEKRLEMFVKIAGRLPEYPFYIVGRESSHFPALKEQILAAVPKNLHYIESPINQRPELLEESKVYLHTGRERGLGIAIAESLSAGCIPVCYSGGDGAEVVRESKVGYVFNSIEDAVGKVKAALEAEQPAPEEISKKAKLFSPEVFEDRIKAMVKEIVLLGPTLS